MQLKIALALLLISTAAAAQPAQQVDAHGFYYKETSTRVVQPRMDLTAAIPGTGTTVGAEYLLDAITSASIAQGVRGDNALTEYRNQVGANAMQTIGPVSIGGNYLRSRESDYDSDTVGATAALELFEKNTTWQLSYAHSFDGVFNRGRMVEEGTLDTDFLSLTVTQLLSPTTVGLLGVEYAYLNGYQQNPYRAPVVAGTPQPEQLPLVRNRYTAFGRIAQLFPQTNTTLQLWYRFYHDDWKIDANTIEFRIYQDLTKHLDGRLAYRYHNQGHAYFAKLSPGGGAPPYTMEDRVYTNDPKLFAFDSHYVEFQLRYQLGGLRGVPVAGWFQAGSVDLTVGIGYTTFDAEHNQPTFGNCGPLDPTHMCADKVIGLGMTLPL